MQATDAAGNQANATLTVTLDTISPVVSVSTQRPIHSSVVTATWVVTETGSGIASYTVDVVRVGDSWTMTRQVGLQGTQYVYQGNRGESYRVRVTAIDRAGNAGYGEALAQAETVRKYYSAAGKRVAMRVDGVVYYLHTDHLGSTSLVTCGSSKCNETLYQGVVARQLYLPYGSPRWGSGTLPTDFTYSGQRQDDTGLMYYRARYYAPYLNRFISADTMVPSPGNPQDLNRYSYVDNRPLNFTDPTGHFLQCDGMGHCSDDGYSVSNPGFTSYDANERRTKLVAYNNKLWWWVRGKFITDQQALAQLTGYAASMIPQDMAGDRAETFIEDVGSVLTDKVPGVGDKYYKRTQKLQQSGFAPVFQDPGAGGNQPYHFWFYVMVAYRDPVLAELGNASHETWATNDTLRSILSAILGNPRVPLVGRSYQDYALGREGRSLGNALRNGDIKIEQVSDYIQTTLSVGSAAAGKWSGTDNLHRMRYDLCLSLMRNWLP